MSEVNVQVVRSLYPDGGLDLGELFADEAAVERVRGTFGPFLAPGFEWAGNQDTVGMPDPARGFDALVESYRELAQAFDDAVLEPIEIAAYGDKVLVIARIRGRLVRSDAPYEALGGAVYTFEEGKIKRVEEFTDLDRARAAAGAA